MSISFCLLKLIKVHQVIIISRQDIVISLTRTLLRFNSVNK